MDTMDIDLSLNSTMGVFSLWHSNIFIQKNKNW